MQRSGQERALAECGDRVLLYIVPAEDVEVDDFDATRKALGHGENSRKTLVQKIRENIFPPAIRVLKNSSSLTTSDRFQRWTTRPPNSKEGGRKWSERRRRKRKSGW